MTFRERIMNTVAGKPSDQLPFIPRLDLWYKANVLGGTLPDKYKNASLMEIVDGLDVGYHCLLPDFSRLEYENADADIGLGVYHLDVNCYETVFHNVEKTVERDLSKVSSSIPSTQYLFINLTDRSASSPNSFFSSSCKAFASAECMAVFSTYIL